MVSSTEYVVACVVPPGMYEISVSVFRVPVPGQAQQDVLTRVPRLQPVTVTAMFMELLRLRICGGIMQNSR